MSKLQTAYFAGGCFWCITPTFKETEGVIDVTSGYSGGDEADPTYLDVKYQRTRHRETIRIDFDPDAVSYGQLLEIFLSSVDPFDPDGQFIDRGHSYTLAVYFCSDCQQRAAEAAIQALKAESGQDVYISVEPFKSFYKAGEEHQDYYLKHPEEFHQELIASGRKVTGIMVVAIAFGCFVYTSNNTVSALALANWPDRVMDGQWVLLVAAEEMLGTFGKVLIGTGVSCAVLSGIMGFYLAASRLMYSMSREGYLPAWFSVVDAKYGTPRNAMIFCILISLSGPILGREALGWFVDMCAIGASIGYLFTCASTLVTVKRDQDGTPLLKVMAAVGVCFSVAFIILQLVPIPGLSGVHFGRESYMLLIVWLILGALFYSRQSKQFE